MVESLNLLLVNKGVIMDEYDIKVIREEGEDTRKELEKLREEVRETNRLLRDILTEIIKTGV